MKGRTSRAFSKWVWNSWKTMLACSAAGTYAIPPFMSTLRFSTKSGTRVHLTLKYLPGCSLLVDGTIS